jgi:PAS domain S-box-containing protein
LLERLNQFLRFARSIAAGLCVFALIALATALDGFAPFEHALMDVRFEANPRQATGRLVIVEIDAKSIGALSTWPWPRALHGEVIDRLTKAGAQRIAFDVDFSSRSTPENDATLAAAIARAEGRVILPAFAQHETTSAADKRTLSSEPLPELQEKSLIGHVNIWPLGSQARTIRAGAFFGQTYRPAMAALVSDQTNQTLDERYIDFSIAPTSIPHISYSDVLQGTFDPNLVRDKTVIIGGTAIELGDRLPVPLYGVLPGVTVQAIAAESMTLDRAIARTATLVSLALAGFLLLMFRWRNLRGTVRACAASLTLAAILFGVSVVLQDIFAISLDLGAPFAVLGFAALSATSADLADRAAKLRAERARSAARQSLINLIVEDSSDGILAVNERGEIATSNAQAATLLGKTQESLTGKQVEAFLPLSADPFTGNGIGGERFPFTFEHTIEAHGSGNGAVLDVVVNRCVRTDFEREPIFVVTLRDVTKRKQTEIAERRAAEERLLVERSKNLFIANMSHELRTPLNAIIGFAEILDAETLGALGNRKYKEYASIVLKSGHHLLDLINSVLEASRVDTGGAKPDPRPVVLDELVDMAIGTVCNGRDYAGQDMAADVTGAGTIQTDPRLLKQILVNLLSNAIKFARPGVPARAIVRAAMRSNGYCRITIEDNGAGMDRTVLDRVTDRFFQADGGFTRRHEGGGLGLYLVRRYIEILGGTLSFESTPGEGTRVHVDLPQAEVDLTQAAANADLTIAA